MTLLSRILGFVRDQVFAITFGAGSMTDAFLVAFKIPNFLRRLFAEGAFAQSFVPVFSEYKETRSPEALKALAAEVSGTLGWIVLLLSIVGSVAAPALIALFAPGFENGGERAVTATALLRITFPYLFFISMVAYCGSVLNTFQKFAVPAFTPVLLNVCLITAALWGAQFFAVPVTALAWGVFAAGLSQLLFQLPSMIKLGLLKMPRWGWSDSGVQKILKLMLPAILGSSVSQINLLLDTIIASFLIAGSLSWLYFADRLVEFPLGVFGIAIATVILPRLSSATIDFDAVWLRRVRFTRYPYVCLGPAGLRACTARYGVGENIRTRFFRPPEHTHTSKNRDHRYDQQHGLQHTFCGHDDARVNTCSTHRTGARNCGLSQPKCTHALPALKKRCHLPAAIRRPLDIKKSSVGNTGNGIGDLADDTSHRQLADNAGN